MQDPLDPGTAEMFPKTQRSKAEKAKDRQTTWRKKMEAIGYVQVSVWVYSHQAPGLQVLASALRDNRHLEAGPARDIDTRRFVKVDR